MYSNNTLRPLKLDVKIKECINAFLEFLLNNYKDSMLCIYLHGSIGRKEVFIQDWSDIDILIIFKYQPPNLIKMLKGKSDMENIYSQTIDLSVYFHSDLVHELFFESRIMYYIVSNLDLGLVLYGELPPYNFTVKQMKESCNYYLDNMSYQICKFIVNNGLQIKKNLKQVIKWVFTYINVSLRAKGVYKRQYTESLNEFSRLHPHIDVAFCETLLYIRENFSSFDRMILTESHTISFDDLSEKILYFIMEVKKNCI